MSKQMDAVNEIRNAGYRVEMDGKWYRVTGKGVSLKLDKDGIVNFAASVTPEYFEWNY